jgi:predicted RNA-binding protein YlqC (UPF0109 family)
MFSLYFVKLMDSVMTLPPGCNDIKWVIGRIGPALSVIKTFLPSVKDENILIRIRMIVSILETFRNR